MGVEYCDLLIPRDNTFRPSAEQSIALINALIAHKYVLAGTGMLQAPGAAEAPIGPLTGGRFDRTEYILKWSIAEDSASTLTYPLAPKPDAPPEDVYYDLALYFSDDFIEQIAERVDPIVSECECGESLSYEIAMESDIFYSGRTKKECPSCGAAFRPQDQVVGSRDWFTDEEGELTGGAMFRFAIKIDCGKCFATAVDAGAERCATATPAFIEICQTALGTELYEVGVFY